MDLGLALGAVLVRVAIAIDGVRAAVFAPAVVGLVLVLVLWGQLRRIDGSATVPQVEIQLLRSIAMFAPLPAPMLEGCGAGAGADAGERRDVSHHAGRPR